jgi:hypothetical protein
MTRKYCVGEVVATATGIVVSQKDGTSKSLPVDDTLLLEVFKQQDIEKVEFLIVYERLVWDDEIERVIAVFVAPTEGIKKLVAAAIHVEAKVFNSMGAAWSL